MSRRGDELTPTKICRDRTLRAFSIAAYPVWASFLAIENVTFGDYYFYFNQCFCDCRLPDVFLQGNGILKLCSIVGKLLYIFGYNNLQILKILV